MDKLTGYFTAKVWLGPAKEDRAQAKRVAKRLLEANPDADARGLAAAIYGNLMVERLPDDAWLAAAAKDLKADPHGNDWW